MQTMGVKKELAKIEAMIAEIDQNNIKKANECDKIKENLSRVKFEVSNVALVPNPADGTYSVKVDYKIPSIMIYFDSDGEVLTNERFKSMNLLDLVSLNDMFKIQEKIKEAQIKNQKGE